MAQADAATERDMTRRGRDATTPRDIPPKGWWDVLRRTWTQIGKDNIGLVAAGIAFYGLLALFPGIGAVVAIAAFFIDRGTIATELETLSAMLPADAAGIVTGQVEEMVGANDTGLSLAALSGLGLALFSASKGISNLITGVNIAYEETETRGFFYRYAVVLGLTVLTAVLLVAALALMVALPVILNAIPGEGTGEIVAVVLRWPLLLAIAILGLAVIYRYAPDRANAKWRWISPGAVLACLLWIIGTAGFAFYVRTFGTYNETFGAIAGVIVLLMWLWLSSYIVLLGAEFDAEMEAQTARDTTTGPPKPMGERGAVKADTVADSPADD